MPPTPTVEMVSHRSGRVRIVPGQHGRHSGERLADLVGADDGPPDSATGAVDGPSAPLGKARTGAIEDSASRSRHDLAALLAEDLAGRGVHAPDNDVAVHGEDRHRLLSRYCWSGAPCWNVKLSTQRSQIPWLRMSSGCLLPATVLICDPHHAQTRFIGIPIPIGAGRGPGTVPHPASRGSA